jgi:DNA-binding NtrC family response regulator
MNKDQTRIIVLDDENSVRELVADLLRSEGYIVQEFAEGIKMLESLENNTPDLIWLDLMLPDVQGLVILQAVTHKFPSVKVICMTAYTSDDVVKSAKTLGAFMFISKPFKSVEEILQITEQALEA